MRLTIISLMFTSNVKKTAPTGDICDESHEDLKFCRRVLLIKKRGDC